MVAVKRPAGVTDELIDRSVRRALGAIPNIHEAFDKVEDNLDSIVQLTAPPAEKHRYMLTVIRDITEKVGEVSACRKGCSHCCNMAVGISTYEAHLIGKHIGVAPVNHRTDLDGIPGSITGFMNVPCPFLKNNECSVYEVRPVACRTHFNLSEFPDLCDIKNYPGNTVPGPNFTSVWGAQVRIHGDTSEFGDIRHFFPGTYP